MRERAAVSPNVEPACGRVDDSAASHLEEVAQGIPGVRAGAFFYQSFCGDSPSDIAYGEPSDVGTVDEPNWWVGIVSELAEQYARSRLQLGGGNLLGGLRQGFANHRLPSKPTFAPPGGAQAPSSATTLPGAAASTISRQQSPPAAQTERKNRYDQAVRAFFEAKTQPGVAPHAKRFGVTFEKLKKEITAYAVEHGLEVPQIRRGGFRGQRTSAAKVLEIEAAAAEYAEKNDVGIVAARAAIAPKHGIKGPTQSTYFSKMQRGILGQSPQGRGKANTATIAPAAPKKPPPTEVEAAKPVDRHQTEAEGALNEKARRQVDFLLGRNQSQSTTTLPGETPNDLLRDEFLRRNNLGKYSRGEGQ